MVIVKEYDNMVRGKEYNKREWLEERKTINMIGYRK